MLRLNAFSLRDGQRLCGLRYSDCSWQHSWNDAGSMSVTIPLSDDMASLDLDTILVEQQTALALIDGNTVVHAGPILESPSWDAETRELSISCGGGWSLFDNRLVLDPLLRNQTIDGELVIDEDNPAPEWTVAYQGTAGDIVRSLIQLTKQWGDVPVDVSPYDGSQSDVVQWDGWEFPVMSDAFNDALDRENAGQLRFDPYLTLDGRLRWKQRWALNGISDLDEPFQWNTMVPGQRVRFTGCGSGGGPLVNDVWASGGKSNDVLLMYRVSDNTAISNTGILTQLGDGNAGTGDSLAALHSYARNQLNASRRDRTWNLQVGAEWNPHVGDRVQLRVNDPFLHSWKSDGTRTSTVVSLIITDVSGDAGGEWLTVACRETGETVNGIRSAVSDPMMQLAQRLKLTEKQANRANAVTRSQTYQVVNKLSELWNSRSSNSGGVTVNAGNGQ